MKQGQQTKRPRGHRGNGRRPSGGGGRNSNFESSGPQGKIRGTAYQVIEKYQALGRDALTFGDRVAAENYFQHAEHYYRVMVANGGVEQRGGRNMAQPQNRPQQPQEQQPPAQSSTPSDSGSAGEGERVASHENAVAASQPSAEPPAEPTGPSSEGIAAEESTSDQTELDGSTA
jgi:hypothetical protein